MQLQKTPNSQCNSRRKMLKASYFYLYSYTDRGSLPSPLFTILPLMHLVHDLLFLVISNIGDPSLPWLTKFSSPLPLPPSGLSKCNMFLNLHFYEGFLHCPIGTSTHITVNHIPCVTTDLILYSSSLMCFLECKKTLDILFIFTFPQVSRCCLEQVIN